MLKPAWQLTLSLALRLNSSTYHEGRVSAFGGSTSLGGLPNTRSSATVACEMIPEGGHRGVQGACHGPAARTKIGLANHTLYHTGYGTPLGRTNTCHNAELAQDACLHASLRDLNPMSDALHMRGLTELKAVLLNFENCLANSLCWWMGPSSILGLLLPSPSTVSPS